MSAAKNLKDIQERAFAAKKSKIAKRFYNTSNHRELFQIGKSYQKDFEQGVKSFAITSTHYPSSQQDTILGLTSFFNHEKPECKILIISDTIFNGSYKSLLGESELHEMTFDKLNITCDVHTFENSFDLLDLFSLVEASQEISKEQYKDVVEVLSTNYDIIFWDVPNVETLSLNPRSYFPLLTKLDSLSLIVSNNISQTKEVEKICDFFSSYGMHIKGILLDSNSLKGDPKNLKWWQRIFS